MTNNEDDIIITDITANSTDERGTKILEFYKGRDHFEIFEDPRAEAAYPFVGYFNGTRSITASRADIAARALQRKELIGLPEGKLIDFNKAVGKLTERR